MLQHPQINPIQSWSLANTSFTWSSTVSTCIPQWSSPSDLSAAEFALALLVDVAHASRPAWLAVWFVYSIYCDCDVYFPRPFRDTLNINHILSGVTSV